MRSVSLGAAVRRFPLIPRFDASVLIADHPAAIGGRGEKPTGRNRSRTFQRPRLLMASSRYRTAPEVSQEMPQGIPYIIGNEAAERFSYYGMRTVLVIFMTQYLRDASGELAVLSEADATAYYHWFGTAVYFTPVAGALLADVFLGKYRTIVSLSIVYCLGHLALAMNDTLTGLALGLGLISLGSGGIKPCVSAHVGDQFGATNASLLPRIYSYFYFSINLGAFVSTLLTPLLLEHIGPHAAFGLPGALMILATWVFWLGRQRFIHVPPGGREFLKEAFGREGVAVMLRLALVYLFIAIFWALFDQSGSTWVLQANKMDRHFLGIEWLPSQIQALNPILILAFIPLYNKLLYPAVEAVVVLTPLRKISFGLFIATGSFLIIALIESRIAAGADPQYRLATRRLHDSDGRRSARIDHCPRVLLHAGTAQDQILHHVTLLDECVARQPVHGRGQHGDSECRRNFQARGCELLPVLCGFDVRGGRTLYSRRDGVQGTHVHSAERAERVAQLLRGSRESVKTGMLGARTR